MRLPGHAHDATRGLYLGGAIAAVLAASGTAFAVAIPDPVIVSGTPGPTILPGNFLENPDMETETRFVEHQIEGPTDNSFADYWHHSTFSGWNDITSPPNGPEPVVSGIHSLRLFDQDSYYFSPGSTGVGSSTQEEFRSFATAIPADAGSPTGLAEKLYFRWHWNYDMVAGTDPSVTMNIRLSNAPLFSLDLGPSLGDNTVIQTGTSNGWEQVTVGVDVPAGAKTFDMIVLTEGSKDALGTMWLDDISVSTIAPVTSLVGDLDGDGFVGINDLNIVLGAWNQNVPPANPLADPSGDGFVGIDDLNTVLGNWNAGTPPTAGAAIPEPASLALLGLGGVALLRHRQR